MQAERIEELMDILGAEVNISLLPHPTLTDQQLTKLQAKAELLMEAIDEQHGKSPLTFPEWCDKRRARAVVLWDRPARWSAPHRQFLRRCLLGANVFDDEVAHVWAWPYDQDAPPLENQVAAMRPATLACIQATGARHVLLIGASSVKLWRRELLIKQVQGFAGVWDRRWVVFPMLNPLAVMREPMLQGEWREDMYRFAEMVNEGIESGLGNLQRRCVAVPKTAKSDRKRCDNAVMVYDPDGVPWCQQHWQQGGKRREAHVSKLTTKANLAQQEGML